MNSCDMRLAIVKHQTKITESFIFVLPYPSIAYEKKHQQHQHRANYRCSNWIENWIWAPIFGSVRRSFSQSIHIARWLRVVKGMPFCKILYLEPVDGINGSRNRRSYGVCVNSLAIQNSRQCALNTCMYNIVQHTHVPCATHCAWSSFLMERNVWTVWIAIFHSSMGNIHSVACLLRLRVLLFGYGVFTVLLLART